MLRVQLHRTHDSILSLEAAWKSLPCPTPFASWEFAQHWLRTHAADTEPFVISVHDESDRIVAIAPWSLVRRRHRLGNRIITGIGEGDGWYHDPLLLRPSEQAIALIVGCLQAARADWDMLRLKLRVEENQELIIRLRQLGPLLEQQDDESQYHLIDLSGGWEAYFQSLPNALRREMRAHTRRLAETSHRYLEGTPENFEHFVHELLRLHQARWASEENRAAYHAINSDEGWKAYYQFLEAFAQAQLQQQDVSLFALEIEGKVAAVDLISPWGSRAYCILRAYDPAFAHFRAGNLLCMWEFERLHDKGIRTIDLGSGPYSYKTRLRNGTGETVYVQVVPGLVGTLYGWWKSHLKPWIQARRAPQPVPAHLASSPSNG